MIQAPARKCRNVNDEKNVFIALLPLGRNLLAAAAAGDEQQPVAAADAWLSEHC